MGATVHKLRSQPILVEAHEIASSWTKAEVATDKAHSMRVDVGIRLLELRQRVEKEEKMEWWFWVRNSGCFDGITKKDMHKVMKLASAADPEAAANAERQKAREGMRKYRAVVKLQETQPKATANVSGSPRLSKTGVLPVVEKILSHIRELTEQNREQLFAYLKAEYSL